MTERENPTEPFWTHDVPIGTTRLHDQPYPLHLRIHTAEERYREREMLYPLQYRNGERDYVMTKASIAVPRMRLTIATFPEPTPDGAIARVASAAPAGTNRRDIGDGQAWYYRQDRLLVLWECYLHEWVRADNPVEDQILRTVWTAFERWLLHRFPHTQTVATPSWEPLYEDQPGAWPSFLQSGGYRRYREQTFLKEPSRPAGEEVMTDE